MQAHAGAQANFAAFMALAKPGETLLAMSLPHGGHLTHGHSVSHSGAIWRAVHYGVNPASGLIDYDQVRDLALEHRPRDRKSTRLNSSHSQISYAVFCLKKKNEMP